MSRGWSHGKEKPVLIVREADYPELQARASSSPWAGMRADAIDYATTTTFDAQARAHEQRMQLRDIMGACALAYILDPSNQPLYLNQITDAFSHWGDIYAALSE